MTDEDWAQVLLRLAGNAARKVCRDKALPPHLDESDVAQAAAERILPKRAYFESQHEEHEDWRSLCLALKREALSVLREAWAHPAGLTRAPRWDRKRDGSCEACSGWAPVHSCRQVRAARGDDAMREAEARAGADDPESQWVAGLDMQAALASLPARQRVVAWSRWAMGLELAEVAAEVGVAVATVKRDLAKAKQRLREPAHPCEPLPWEPQ